MQTVISNRVVILSASFETYLSAFLEAFISHKSKFVDHAKNQRTGAGNKLYGEVIKLRGLSERILKFGELAPAKILSISKLLPYLDDVYMLRNVLAHRAGIVDAWAASQFKHVNFKTGDRVTLSVDMLLELAVHVLRIAELLDSKISKP